MAVMDVMLSGLDSDETTLARCRQVLTLWIAGLDMLSKEAEQPDWLPRVHPHSSGQCDLLLKGNPAALTEADEETYLRVTGQQDLPAHRRIPQVTFSKTVRYWHRFESWLAQQLQDIRGIALLLCLPLRTVRAGFPAYRSGFSKLSY